MQDVQLIHDSRTFVLHGVSKTHQQGTSYSDDVRELMDRMWGEIGTKKLPHLGVNHMIYDRNDVVIAGVELKPEAAEIEHNLQVFTVTLSTHAYCKHIGPYDRLCDAYDRIHAAAAEAGLKAAHPGVEVYGHWDEDISKLETEIYQSVE